MEEGENSFRVSKGPLRNGMRERERESGPRSKTFTETPGEGWFRRRHPTLRSEVKLNNSTGPLTEECERCSTSFWRGSRSRPRNDPEDRSILFCHKLQLRK
ncbi:hypothetical protein CDAR_294781 [Caerostris darwini]|uniref:Uncharacterized protein n=1 Tax=Caerostris darwini TaxID=1538125 RepID=A0AAV4UKR1_9ARAC|nr:hypothetical protein CDAR_294781 [Caerostris darwini]